MMRKKQRWQNKGERCGMMEPYSVLMSVYAKEKADFLRQSIDSMLAQTVRTDDFVILCDGPLTEELDSVIEAAKRDHPKLFRVVRLTCQGGLGNALKTGVPICRNEWIARMDSDDISVPDRCEKQLQFLKGQYADLVGGNVAEFTGSISNLKASRRVPQDDDAIKQFAKRRNPFNHPTVMFRKSAVLKAGNYQDCKGFEDYYLWARMLKRGMVGHNIQETLVYMRTDEGMYQRRGSLPYAWLGIKARWRIFRIGYSSFLDFCVSAGGQLMMSLIPLRLRTYCYQRFLRG